MADEIYKGIRGKTFNELIKSLLRRGNLKEKYVKDLISAKNMKLYEQSFTHQSANSENNYEVFEQVGDVLVGQFIINYCYKRFPQLKCTRGVKVVARLKINLGSKESLYKIGESLGFWEYISATDKEREIKKKSLIEDVFEAFLGCTSQILDEKYKPGVGYAICYDILSSIFDNIDISLAYDDLYDAKTRFKEIIDKYPNLTKIEYTDTHDEIFTANLFITIDGKRTFLGSGRAPKKADALQKASKEGIEFLNKRGFKKDISDEYLFFCK
jgi:dsRNA-specific ribonuclease